MDFVEILREPWPWYVAGPLIGLIVPLLLVGGSKLFGFSANFRHACAACFPQNVEFFNYDWKKKGSWNLTFLVGTILGGFLAGWLLQNPEPVQVSTKTVEDLQALGINDMNGMMPSEIFSWSSLNSVAGITVLIVGGFLVGFGAKYAGGCTSGHAISGLADLQSGSLIAVIGFFIGGLVITHLVLPLIL